MLSDADKARLIHILDAIDKIQQLVDGLTLQEFRAQWETQLAVERLLEIIGEAANRVSIELQDRHPEIPWAQIVGMRNFLSHEYFRVDPAIVWETATKSIPLFDHQIAVLVQDDESTQAVD